MLLAPVNSLIILFVVSMEFPTWMIMSFANRHSFTSSYPIYMPFHRPCPCLNELDLQYNVEHL